MQRKTKQTNTMKTNNLKSQIESQLEEVNKLNNEAYKAMRESKEGTLMNTLARNDFYLSCCKIQALEMVLQML